MTTSRITRVVVGVDGSETAQYAALWAAQEAKVREVPLTVMHASDTAGSPPTSPEATAPQRPTEGTSCAHTTASVIRDLHPALRLDVELSPLAPAERLIASSGHGALIVTGTRGRGGFAGLLLGSVSRTVAARTRGPLVVVRGPRTVPDQSPVVLGVAPEPAQSAIEFAFDAARRYGAPVQAVRAAVPGSADIDMLQPPTLSAAGPNLLGARPPRAMRTRAAYDYAIEREVAEVGVAIAAVRDRYPEVHVEITTTAAEPADALSAAGETARLVVLGAPRHHRAPVGAGLGHVAGRTLAHCPAPLAVVPEARE